ncbi:uncharacterized, partial [Tachysurus ichikawai]
VCTEYKLRLLSCRQRILRFSGSSYLFLESVRCSSSASGFSVASETSSTFTLHFPSGSSFSPLVFLQQLRFLSVDITSTRPEESLVWVRSSVLQLDL